jgi:hypothetical protein
VPLTVYWKGQSRFPASRKLSLINGFNLSVSDASGTNLPQQVRDAKRFLARNVKEIGSLRRLRLTAVLDFGVDTTTKSGVFFLRPRVASLKMLPDPSPILRRDRGREAQDPR